ncbi:MAG: hypothetical protein HDT29_01415 [Clostridiales bacterium]|nr:hypothetical protein [Clostridiales bacterium]
MAYASAGDLYDASKNEFDFDALQELCSKLIDKSGRITPDDLQSFVTGNGVDKFGSKVATVGDVEVEIGGQTWRATSLVISQSNDVGLTLLTKNSLGKLYFERNYNGAYAPSGATPCVMYSTSMLRKTTIMTMSPISGEYIIKPNGVAYQHYQTGSPVRANEALDITTGCAFLDTYKFHEKAGYSDWGNDNVWLPSYTEATEIWNNASLFTAGSRTRSTKIDNDVAAMQLLGSTARGDVDVVWETHVAFYLNLTKALESFGLAYPKSKTNIQYYTGSDLSFTLEKFNADALVVSTPTYLGLNGVTALPTSTSTAITDGEFTLSAREVGKYTVKMKPKAEVNPKTGENWVWVDGTTTEKEYVFYIKNKVSEPKFSENSLSSITNTYNKSEQEFTITGYNKDLMEIKASGVADLTFDGNANPAVFKVTKAKTYTVPVDLKDTTFMEWSTVGDTATKYLTVTINKMKIVKPALADPSQNSKPYTGSEVSFPLTNYTPNSGVTITKPDSPSGARVDGINLKATDAATYEFSVSLEDKDNTEWDSGGALGYTISVTIIKGQIKKPSLDSSTFKDKDSKVYDTTITPKGATFTVYNNNSAVSITLADSEQAAYATVSGNTITITKADTYVFNVAIANSNNAQWEGGTTSPYTLTVTVTRKDVAIPTFIAGANKKTYNGSEQTFSLTWDSSIIDVKNESGEVVTSIKEKNAKEYLYTLNLKDTDNLQWAGTNVSTSPQDLPFTMEKKSLKFTITCSESGTTPTWATGTKDVIFTVVVSDVETEDDVKLRAYYMDSKSNKSYDFDAIDDTSVANTLKATMPTYLTSGGYVFGIELPDGKANNNNYKLPTASSGYTKNFNIKGQGLTLTADNMPWICKYRDKDGLEIPVDIIGDGYVTGKAKVTYNTYEYEFYVDVDVLAALGAEIDTSKGTNGISGDTKWTDATTTSKTMTVYWKPAEGFEGVGGSFTLTYDIEKAKYDLSNTKWDYTTSKEYNPLLTQTVKIIDLPKGLTLTDADYLNNRFKAAGTYEAEVVSIINSNSNYYNPSLTDKDTYIYKDGEEFPWKLEWQISPKKLNLTWVEKYSDNNDFIYYIVSGDEAERVDSYLYYRASDYNNTTGEVTGTPIALSDIEVKSKQVDAYWAVAVLKDKNNYEIENNREKRFTVGSYKEIVKVEFKDAASFVYNGNQQGNEIKVSSDENTLTSANIVKKYYKDSVSDGNLLSEAPTNVGKYILVVSLQEGLEDDYEIIIKNVEFEIEKAKITVAWDKSGAIPKISNGDKYKDIIGYIYYDSDGNELPNDAELEIGKTYTVKAILKGNYGDNYEFISEDGVTVLDGITDKEEFTLTQKPNNGDGNDVGIGSETPDGNENNENNNFFGGSLEEMVAKLKEYWQLIVSIISIILMLVFISKTIGYENKRKQNKKTIEKKYNTFYGIALFGLTTMTWNLIACVLMCGALVTFIIMLIAKKKYKKSNEELDDAKDEFERKQKEAEGKRHDEQLQMMLMGMLGGGNGQNGQGGQSFVYQQPALGAEDIRGIVADTMNNMLPNVTQYLPQEASHSDELIQQLMEQNAQNEERMERMMRQFAEQNKSGVNEDTIERLVEKLSSQRLVENVAVKEVAATNANDEKIEMLTRNQEMLMKQMMELSSRNNDKQVVMPYMQQPIVQQPIMPQPVIQQPSEKVVERIIEKPVEKIVEKEVVKEVPIEKIVPVPMPVEKPAKSTKVPAQRLTLDEAYAKLSANQKKIFDTLKAYALSKDKCKEKRSTYFTVLGQSTVNPLVKLTIKKNTTVAMFKMEDEYFKDIRRNAGSDGTKVKVKESEVVVGDNQALATAKDMIDLREDQIERYNEYLKEQKSMRKK